MLPKPIQKILNQAFAGPLKSEPVGGGSINSTFKITDSSGTAFFLKWNRSSKFPGLFEKEKNGLDFIGRQAIVRVPNVLLCDQAEDHQVLALEWIETGLTTPSFWEDFGEQMAALHRVTSPTFGFIEDNYMGALSQLNEPQKRWGDFFTLCRLQPQIHLAFDRGLLTQSQLRSFEHLFTRINSIFNEEKPSLLHGDLWSGNFMCNQLSQPLLIDPAVYFGHRNMDLAMTTLFGGFNQVFYDAYHYHFPLPPNYEEQWEICNLYPLLIHLNLFGLSYLRQIESTLEKFKIMR